VSFRRNRTGYVLPIPKLIFGGIFIPLGPWLLLVDLSRPVAPGRRHRTLLRHSSGSNSMG
jgi:hypothetical protein